MSFKSLIKKYAIIFFIAIGFALRYSFNNDKILFIATVLGALLLLWSALQSLYKREINIAVFNLFAIVIAFLTRESVAIPSAITAALGRAAKRGVIIKGGAWLDPVNAAFYNFITDFFSLINSAKLFREKN